MAAGPYLFGLLVDHFGYGVAWAVLLLPVIVTSLPLIAGSRRVLSGHQG
jgi:hypothetical protein